MQKMLSIQNTDEEKFLRKKTASFDFSKHSKEEASQLVKKMRATMEDANGIGLAANQIGIDARVFVAKANNKFYAIFNPEIVKEEEPTKIDGEGCLSVPGRFGSLKRYNKVVLRGFDRNNKPLKIKAWNLLAWIFQHEVDHLDGKLFIDKLE